MAAPASTVPVAATGSSPTTYGADVLEYVGEGVAAATTLLQHMPVVGDACATFLAFQQLAGTAKSNKEALSTLRKLCDVVIKGVLTSRANRPGLPEEGFVELKEHVDKAEEVAKLCNGVGVKGRLKRFVLARKISNDIAGIRSDVLAFCSVNNLVLADGTRAKVDKLAADLAGELEAMKQLTVTQDEYDAMEKEVASMTKELEVMGIEIEAKENLEAELRRSTEALAALEAEREEQRRMADLASKVEVPSGAPRIRDWFVEREGVILKACDRLGVSSSTSDLPSEEPRMVGLAGPSGAGKSTVASMVVRREDVRAAFHKGVLWLQVGQGAKDRLTELMNRLAGMVYETVMQKSCRPPRKQGIDNDPEDGAAYIREVVDESSIRFLVVVDDVWEVEVLEAHRKAGVWVLYTTREHGLLPEAIPLRLDQVREEEAELVLRRAADLKDDARLPNAAYELMARCDFMMLDLVLVGRWGKVRRRSSERAWKTALDHIEKAQEGDEGGQPLSWRAALLRGGLEELACDNSQNKELYLALAVIPKGVAFPSEVPAVLLYGEELTAEELEAAGLVTATLECWSILALDAGGMYRVHDEHADFIQGRFAANHDVQNTALPRWRVYISSVQALLSFSGMSLVEIWDLQAQIGGESVPSRPYGEALASMDPSSADLSTALQAAKHFDSCWKIYKTLRYTRELVETAKINNQDLAVLQELCDVVIKRFFIRERCAEYSAGIEEALQRLQKHMDGAREVAQLCNERVNQILPGRNISRDIAAVKQNVLDFATTINVALTHELHEKLDAMAARLADQMHAHTVDEAARAATALSYAREMLASAATLFREVPLAGQICATFLAFEELVDTAKSNKEDLAVLRELCDVVIKSFLMRERRAEYSAGIEEARQHLMKHMDAAREVAQLCNGRVKQRLLGRKISRDIASVKQGLLDFSTTINVALTHELREKLDVNATRLADQEEYMPSSAQVAGAPRLRDWYVERENLMTEVCDRLGVGSSTDAFQEPQMVGLAGPGGTGKSTVASMVVARGDVRTSFYKGVLWLPVGQGAKNRLPALMFNLAEKVYETVMKKTCRPPRKANVLLNTEDGAAYIQEVVDERSRRFLVVADDVREVEVLRELERAGVWVLYTTREVNLLPEDPPLRVDEVTEDEAEMILRGAAELIDLNAHLPKAAYELMRKCEYSVLDLVFVGRWSEVRGRSDDRAWRTALGRILQAQAEGEGGKVLSWRAAVLRAGLDELAWNNPKSKELYLALAILPTGMTFPSEVGAFLLYGNNFSPEDKEATERVLETLERWSIVTLEVDGEYRVHEDHVGFVRDCLLANRNTQDRVLPRWRKHISSVQALNTYTSGWLVKIWSVLAKVENAVVVPSPYDPVLDAMDASDPGLPRALKKAAEFHYERQDWSDAYAKYSQLRMIEENTFGEDSLVVANTLHSLGMCANEMLGREEETERLLRRSLEIQKEKRGPDHPDVANTLHSLGVCIREAGKTDEAEWLLRQALAIRKEKGNDPLSLARIQYSLGVCAYKTDRLQETEEDLLKEALAIRLEWLGPDHPEVANALYYLGLCDHKAGRTGEGEKKLHRALDIFEQKMGHDQQDVADTLFSLGKCALEGGERTAEAEDYYRRALVIREKKEATNQKKVADTLHALGVCESKAGKTKEAEEYFRRCNRLLKEQSGAAFRFEAGIETRQETGEGKKTSKVSGFMESTTDFVHSRAESEGTDFGEVLKEAGGEGHAEADLRHLLAELAPATTVSSGSIQCKGVFSSLSTEDFEYAKVLRLTIMLRGTAMLSAAGDRLSVFVSPVLVPSVPPAASADSPGSAASANSEGELGRGVPARFYMRIACDDELGNMKCVGELAEKNGVFIHTMLQSRFEDVTRADFVITTHHCKQSQVDMFSDSISKEEWANGVPLVMPLLPYSSRVRRFSDADAGTSP